MDDNNEEYRIPGSLLDYNKYLLEDNMECVVLFYQNKPIDITLPFFVEKEITETEPGARGDTATNVSKPAKIENGYEISVPLFINVGDIVKIDTRTGQYAERVRKGAN
jgi:elongation factor P